jgi:hypothetical protein
MPLAPSTLRWFLACTLGFIGLAPHFTHAQTAPPAATAAPAAPAALHERIDQLVEGASVGALAPVAQDADFVRRVYLDLTGIVPTATEARAFFEDRSPNKREALVDRLLASPGWVRHMAARLDVMLMERRTEATIPPVEWRKFLIQSLAANKPWDQLAREILSADGVEPALRPAAKFYLDRAGEPNLLTRDTARIFFGMDLQCAQCHDHPLVDDYLQSDYYGIFAFFNRSFVFTDKKDAKQIFFAEKAEGEAKFSSVFTKQAGQTGPHLPEGEALVEPVLKKGEEYTVAPGDNVRPVPKFSRRAELARQATSGTNRAFNRNMANRLWAMLMGRGLVEPVDLHHADNPPSHPQLLDLLTDELVALKFNMKAFQRQIVLSRTYQRSLDLPTDFASAATAAAGQITQLESQRAAVEANTKEAKAQLEKATTDLQNAEKALLPQLDELEKAETAANKANEAAVKAAGALAAAQQTLASKQDLATTLSGAAAKTQEAAKKLPEDKELAAAAEKFQAKAQAVAGEVAAATKAATDLMAPAKTAADALAAANAAYLQAAEKVATARAPLAPLRQQLAASDVRYHAAVYQQEQHAARLADAKLLVQLQTQTTAMNGVREAANKAVAEVNANKQLLTRLAAELPPRQSELAEAQKLRDEAARLFTESQQQVAARQDLAKILAEASTQAEAAKAKLPNDAELAQAAAQVKTKLDQSQVAVTEAQKLLAAREPAAKATMEKFVAAQQLVTSMTGEMTAAQQRQPTLEAASKQAQEKIVSEQQAFLTTQTECLKRWSNRAYMTGLRQLTPEQLAWSVLQVAGMVDSHRVAAEAELSKTVPLTDAIKADPAQMAARSFQIEQIIQEKLAGPVNEYVALFGGAPGQNQTDFFATVDQALYFTNGGSLRAWLGPNGTNLTSRMLKLEGPAAAEELYLTVLSRQPLPKEIEEVTKYLAPRTADKPLAVQELAWALVTSAEFRFNH